MTFLLSLALALAPQGFDLDPSNPFDVQTGPFGVAAGDISGDGFVDLVVTVGDGERLDCWFNDCQGGFYFAGDFAYPAGSDPGEVVLADFDGDGDLDAATVFMATDQVHVIFNDGSGAYGGAVLLPTGALPVTVDAGDYDGDGDQDLVVANQGSNDATVFTNDGLGNFTAATLAGGNVPWGAAFGDFDGDGDLDVVIMNHDDCQFDVWYWDGAAWGNRTTVSTGNLYPHRVATCDVDGDGLDDVLTPATDHAAVAKLAVIRSLGGTSWDAQAEYDTGGLGSETLTLADLDCDGDCDVLVGNLDSDDMSLLENLGGTFGAAQVEPTGAEPTQIAVGEFTGSGALDFAVANHDADQVDVRLNRTCDLQLQLVGGSCPGPMDFQVTGATPFGDVFVGGGMCGCFVIPAGKPCEGLVLGLTNPILVLVAQADANGVATFTVNPTARCCGMHCLQVVDVTTCNVSAVFSL